MADLALFLAAAGDAAPAAEGGLEFIKAGLLIFFLVFVGIVAWTLMGRSGRFDKHARIPLQDDPVEPIETTHRGGA